MSNHAIIIIKNNNKYLQYFDNRWNSFLFLNCKINKQEDTDKVIDEVKEKLNLEVKTISYKGSKTHSKFSVSNNCIKTYKHSFFLVEVFLNDYIMSNEFNLNNVNFKWYSYNDLLNDLRIMEVNSDIVEFVKEMGM